MNPCKTQKLDLSHLRDSMLLLQDKNTDVMSSIKRQPGVEEVKKTPVSKKKSKEIFSKQREKEKKEKKIKAKGR